jgi:hypothetical protein
MHIKKFKKKTLLKEGYIGKIKNHKGGILIEK